MNPIVLSSLAINRSISYSPSSNKYRQQQLRVKSALIEEAISWPGDIVEGQFIFTKVWQRGIWSVELGKFGKEYYREDRPNRNDMLPCVFKNGTKTTFDASFRAIFRLAENLFNAGKNESLIALGCLFVRDAFLVDHQFDGTHYRYCPPTAIIQKLMTDIGDYKGVPIDAFLQYVDAIAWQEDVKYTTLGKPITSDVGRTNNMLTYARFCACLLGRSSYAEMLNKYSMGVSALPKSDISTVFPELNTTY